jgi:hypothetical protein
MGSEFTIGTKRYKATAVFSTATHLAIQFSITEIPDAAGMN